jgi:hypothetical protein
MLSIPKRRFPARDHATPPRRFNASPTDSGNSSTVNERDLIIAASSIHCRPDRAHRSELSRCSSDPQRSMRRHRSNPVHRS